MRADEASASGRHLRGNGRGAGWQHIRHREHNINERQREEIRHGAVTHLENRENNYLAAHQQEQFYGFGSISPNPQHVMRLQLDAIQGTQMTTKLWNLTKTSMAGAAKLVFSVGGAIREHICVKIDLKNVFNKCSKAVILKVEESALLPPCWPLMPSWSLVGKGGELPRMV